MTSIAVPAGRRVVIDGDGRLHSTDREPIDIVADQLYAVLMLWGREGDAWLGWLTTTMQRSVSFSAADLADPVIQNWLRALPAWDHARLWHATTTPGIHLVWRR